MDSSERFRLWYRQPIETLIAKDEHTGFAVLMLALPLLERHLRQKLCITKDNLDDSTGFHQRLVEPDLALFVLDFIERDLPGFENIAGNKPLPTVATTAIGSSVSKI